MKKHFYDFFFHPFNDSAVYVVDRGIFTEDTVNAHIEYLNSLGLTNNSGNRVDGFYTYLIDRECDFIFEMGS